MSEQSVTSNVHDFQSFNFINCKKKHRFFVVDVSEEIIQNRRIVYSTIQRTYMRVTIEVEKKSFILFIFFIFLLNSVIFFPIKLE